MQIFSDLHRAQIATVSPYPSAQSQRLIGEGDGEGDEPQTGLQRVVALGSTGAGEGDGEGDEPQTAA